MDKYCKILFACALYVISGCAKDKSNREGVINIYKSYDLEAFTVQIPSTWKPLNFAAQGLQSSNKNKKYLFLNTQSRDTVLRETILIEIEQREGTFSFSKLEKELLKNMSEGQDQIRIIDSKSIKVQESGLKIVELTCRNIELNLNLIELFAFYEKDKRLAFLLWTGLNHPGIINKKHRELFMHVVNSVQWKKT